MSIPTAITIDSTGQTCFGGWLPPLPGPGPSVVDRQYADIYREVLRRDPPTPAVSDPQSLARSFTHAVYVAIKTVMTALGGATIVVSVSNTSPAVQAKSLTASTTDASESEWTPAPPDHPLAKLFRHINPQDTVTDYLAERSMCESLFGETVEWVRPTVDGSAPAELWNLRRNYLTEVPVSAEYPCGGWRLQMQRPMYGFGTAGMVRIRREDTLHQRNPNPVHPWSGHSALQAGSKYVDFLTSVLDSRQQSMDHGFSPDMLVQLKGVSKEQMTEFMNYLRTFATGQNRGQRIVPVDGDTVNVVPVNTPPDKMMYPQGYDQGTAAVLALFGVPPSVAGLTESGSYASYYAAARQFRETTLNFQVKRWGEFWTKHLAVPYFGDGVKVDVKLPALQDPDLKDRQVGTLLGANAMKINKLLATYDMPPVEWGEVTPAEFQMQLQQKYTPQQPQPGPDGVTDPKGAWAPLPDQVEAAGITSDVGSDEPPVPGDDAESDRPEVGAASVGSLPPVVRKTLRMWSDRNPPSRRVKALPRAEDANAYFDRLLAEVCGGTPN